jgi:glycosyltransferase involved in cell wall biosynthesis
LYPPDCIGGYERGCRQAVDALRAKGHDVRVLTTAPRFPVPHEPHVARTMRLVDIWDHYSMWNSAPATLHLAESESFRLSAFNVHSLLAELESFQPDVVYLWMLVGIGGLGLVACLDYLKVPWVWHLMDDVPLALCRSCGQVVSALARYVERLEGARFLVCSQQLLEELEAGGIRLPGEVQMLPNWVTGSLPAPREAYCEDGRLRIANATSLIERKIDKGVDLLIEAAGLLRKWGHDRFSIDIYGQVDDPYFPALVHKHEVSEIVSFRGTRTQAELATLFPTYDVCAFPTQPREPFGFAPLEAAACGVVPLFSNRCGIAEWFVHEVHCLKATRSAQAFAQILARVLDGKIDLRPIGTRVSALIRREFHLDVLLPRIEKALHDAARDRRKGGGTVDDVYRMAVLAEKLERIVVQERLSA